MKKEMIRMYLFEFFLFCCIEIVKYDFISYAQLPERITGSVYNVYLYFIDASIWVEKKIGIYGDVSNGCKASVYTSCW